ncbi:MAG: hypothetical protein U0223_20415 [Nitrospira sp.]
MLKPNGVSDDQIELFEANLGRPGVGRHGLTNDLTPPMLQAQFHQSRFKAKSFGESGQNSAEGIKSAWASHAAS